RTARELMVPIAITLGEKASVAQAASLMALEGVHHLPIVDPTGKLVGILSTMDVVRWLATNEGSPART
ncbi:MAG: CBS domain-containing protein, partial [Deltaproteobacteria bacterium]|nr:CBS domain-containing protein [Deltaproteobacteria bacterium]